MTKDKNLIIEVASVISITYILYSKFLILFSIFYPFDNNAVALQQRRGISLSQTPRMLIRNDKGNVLVVFF